MQCNKLRLEFGFSKYIQKEQIVNVCLQVFLKNAFDKNGFSQTDKSIQCIFKEAHKTNFITVVIDVFLPPIRPQVAFFFNVNFFFV